MFNRAYVISYAVLLAIILSLAMKFSNDLKQVCDEIKQSRFEILRVDSKHTNEENKIREDLIYIYNNIFSIKQKLEYECNNVMASGEQIYAETHCQ